MSRRLPYIPFYIRDFLADTEHLSGEQTGVYCLLLMHMWMNGGWLSSDDKVLARLGRVTPFKWRRMRGMILPLMTAIDARRITQKRLLTELCFIRGVVKKTASRKTSKTPNQTLEIPGLFVATRAGAQADSILQTARTTTSIEADLARATPQAPTPDTLDLIRRAGL